MTSSKSKGKADTVFDMSLISTEHLLDKDSCFTLLKFKVRLFKKLGFFCFNETL